MSNSSGWRSAILTGTVTHRRLKPFSHGFRYRVAMYRLDLDELDMLNRRLRLFGADRARPVSFWRTDHLPDVRALVRAHGIVAPITRVELVTGCRVFGYAFNPVSFYFCYDPGDRLVAIACEVNNTFGESHTYVLKEADGPGRWHQKKVFHVSPFFTLDGSYRFRFTISAEQFDAGIDLYRDGVAQFVSHLRLVRRPLTDGGVLRNLLRYPFITVKVIGAIHWQALRLWWKGAAYHPKPPYDPESARRLTES